MRVIMQFGLGFGTGLSFIRQFTRISNAMRVSVTHFHLFEINQA